MEYIRKVDFAAFDATAERVNQRLLDETSGATSVGVNCVKTPPGGGSASGLHVHAVDQIFYVLKGAMTFEIDGGVHLTGPGTLVVLPANVSHRNWNASNEPTIHLVFNAGLPKAGIPFATRV